MSLLARVHETRSSWSGPLTSSSPEIAKYFQDPPAASGVRVGPESALTYPAFWAAVSLISADIASVPFILYKREPNGGKSRFTSHRLYRILHDEPNPEMTAMVFRETLQAHVLTWGNAYAEIERDRLGQPAALWPITPDRVRVYRDRRDLMRPLRYGIANPNGGETVLPSSDVLHIPGLGYDGLIGYSVVAKARESIGLGLAMQQFGGAFFGNGSTFGGVFSAKGILPPKTRTDLETNLRNFHQGLDRAHRFVILEGDMKYDRLGIPPEDAQFLESRSFHISEICRWFNLSPHKLADLSRATFSNIEHLAIDHVVTCLRRWWVRWEQECNRKLIARPERNIQFCEHLIDGMLRGDLQSRYAAYAVGRQWGWLSADDIAELENRNPLPGGQGQVYLTPQNMWPADKLDAMMQAQASKGQAPAPSGTDPTTARALELLDDRLAKADQALATTRAEVEDAHARADALKADVTATTHERDLAKADAAEKQAALDQLTLLASGVRAERDRLLADIADAQRIAKEAEQGAAEEAIQRAAAEQAKADAETRIAEAAALVARADTTAAQAAQERDRLLADLDTARMQAQADADALRAAAQTATDTATAAREALAVAEERARVAVEQAAEWERTSQQDDAARQAAEADALKAIEAAEQSRLLAEAAEARRVEAERALEAAVNEAGESATRAGAAVAERDTAVQQADALRLEFEQARERHAQAMAEADERRTALETDLQTIRQAETDALTTQITAHRELVVDVMRRMVERETDHARRRQANPEKFRQWLDTFYDGHADLMRTALLPAMRVHLAFIRSSEDPIEATRRAVEAHVQRSLRELRDVFDGDGESYAVSVPALLYRWDQERPTDLADALMTKELEYARRI